VKEEELLEDGLILADIDHRFAAINFQMLRFPPKR
jgi:hypothetical protein